MWDKDVTVPTGVSQKNESGADGVSQLVTTMDKMSDVLTSMKDMMVNQSKRESTEVEELLRRVTSIIDKSDRRGDSTSNETTTVTSAVSTTSDGKDDKEPNKPTPVTPTEVVAAKSDKAQTATDSGYRYGPKLGKFNGTGQESLKTFF